MPAPVNKRQFATLRVLSAVVSVIISAFLTWKFSVRLTNSPDILAIIATIFSILAAALIAIVSILGDPSMLIDPSWRKNTLVAQETQRKLHRKTDIFILYLVVLGLLTVFALVDKKEPAYPYIQSATFFFTVLGFLASVTLPHSLKEIQRKRLNDAIAARSNSGENGRA